MTKAFLAVEGGSAAASTRIHQTVEELTEQVVSALTRRMPGGGTVHIEDIQDQVELALMRSGEHKIARAYVLYRAQQAQRRAEEQAKSPKEEHLVKVTLEDGSYHEVDSSELAFSIAGSMAFKEATKRAGLMLLEPVMDVEVVTPEEYTGDIVGDLSSRRGKISGMEPRAGTQTIKSQVPLEEMFGYATEIRSMTQGRATYTMQFSHYDAVPESVANDIIEKMKG